MTMKIKSILKSKLDSSINIVYENMMEARYVQRNDRYISLYVSSQDGCNKACRMCHLTQTGQTSFNHASVDDYVQQLTDIWSEFLKLKSKKQPKLIHVNFMARGEPFANPILMGNIKEAFTRMTSVFAEYPEISVRFNFSTIMPLEVDYATVMGKFENLSEFNYHIYYSLYSPRESFRKRWLPKAMPAEKAILILKALQMKYSIPIAIHHALIADENDTIGDILDIKAINDVIGLEFKFNLVRYNPYSEACGKETSELRRKNYMAYMEQLALREGSKTVTRVGFDIKASCGMFVK